MNYRRNHLHGVPAVAPDVVNVEPDDALVETADIAPEPGVQPDPAVQVAPIAPPARHMRIDVFCVLVCMSEILITQLVTS